MSSHKYRECPSKILGPITRPLIDIEVYSFLAKEWLLIENVLVDTGADVSILPYSQGLMFVETPEKGERHDVGGIVPHARLAVYRHDLKIRLDGKEFEAPMMIAESDDVPPILGRYKAIDKFLAQFDKGQELKLS